VLDQAEKQRILVVDDEPAFTYEIQHYLEEKNYNVVIARNGREALNLVDRGDIDLILLDIIMPVLNGVEVTNILKRNPATKDIPIIVVSTMTEYKDRVEFFRIGANDYMPKPIDAGELQARVAMQLQVVRLRREIEKVNLSLSEKNKLLEEYFARIEHDLAVARRVQRALQPNQQWSSAGVDVQYKHVCKDLGSDFIDYLEDDQGLFHLILADVSGHGIPSALLASQLKVLFLTMSQRALSPKKTVEQINQLSGRFLSEGYYFTAIYLQYNPTTRQLSLVNAGHVPLLYFDRKTGKAKLVESDNAPLGFFDAEQYKETQLNTQPGDFAVVLTDGITEHMNANNEMFDISGVIEVVKANRELEPGEIVDQLFAQAREFGSTPVFSDDVTIGIITFPE